MVLYVFISLLGGVPLCIPYGLYSGTSLGGTTRGTLEGYLGRVLSIHNINIFRAGNISLISITRFMAREGFLFLVRSKS